MRFAGLRPLIHKAWGGLVTVDDPVALAAGFSSLAQDVCFKPSAVQTRPGLTDRKINIANFANALWLKTFIALDNITRRLLVFDSLGNLWKEVTLGTLTLIQSGFSQVSRVRAQTIFGREFMGMSDGKIGIAPPLQFSEDTDGSSILTRVSTQGPGAPPAASNNGGSPGGNIAAGVHGVRVLFVTRTGFITPPSPPQFWTATGADQVIVSNIPTGPPGLVVQRILAFTQVNDSRYFYLEGTDMVIQDNTTTTVTLDFVDATLASGVALDDSSFDVMNLQELPFQAGFSAYNDRLLAFGGKYSIPRVGDLGPLNLSFDGGFLSNVPLGWTNTRDPSAITRQSGLPGSTGDAIRFSGDGVTSNYGEIQNNVGVQTYLLASTEYKGRIRAKRNGAGPPGGGIAIFTSTLAGPATTGWVVNWADLTSDWATYEGVIFLATTPLSSATFLRVAGSLIMDAANSIDIDSLEIFPTKQPNTGSLVWVSLPGQPEAFDAVSGFFNVRENDGQDIRAGFALRGNWYAAKQESLHVTRDNGDVPANWPVDLVSENVGTYSLDGVAPGEGGWVAIAGKEGLFKFDGGVPEPLSDEIEPTWKRINWDFGHLIVVAVDPLKNRIMVEVPLDGSPVNSHMLVLDYTVSFAFYPDAPDRSRKWALWTISTPFLARVKRDSEAWQTFMGTSTNDGIIAELDETKVQDFNAFIDAQYETAFLGGDTGRMLWGGFSAAIEGVGSLLITAIKQDRSTEIPLKVYAIRNPKLEDLERMMQVYAERMKFRFQIDAGAASPGDSFILRKFVPLVTQSPYAPYRGVAK